MKRIWLLFAQTSTILLAAYFVILTLKPEWFSNHPSSDANTVQLDASLTAKIPQGSLRAAARKASEAVVSINTSKSSQRREGIDDLYKYLRGDEGGIEPQQIGLGSGVIVSAGGYILTNNHVVEGADEIDVILNDGRHASAKIVGTDIDTDLAVLKIELDKLPAILLGNSDVIQVGDQVLAVGNPFGVGQTVTSGIVSALGRNQLGINTFENFIQTDAAINPGNSGGALVDIEGNLLGINTAIYSRSGGSMGIGFAIPVSTAKQVWEAIAKDGKVTRGWIGIEPSDISAEMAEMFELKTRQGVILKGVQEGGPAASAGIRPGDVIVKIANQKIINVAQLLTQVAVLKPGVVAHFVIERKGQTIEVDVVPGIRRPRKLLESKNK